MIILCATCEDPDLPVDLNDQHIRESDDDHAPIHHVGCYARRDDTPDGDGDPLADPSETALTLEEISPEDDE